MIKSPYYRLSLISGCVWAAIAYVLGGELFGVFIWSGVIVSPVIGLVAGLLFRSLCGKPMPIRLVASLATLYLTAALFGLAIGVADAFLRPLHAMPLAPNRDISSVIIQAMNATLWGITFTGYVAFLWPMAWLNHSLVCRWGAGCDPARVEALQ